MYFTTFSFCLWENVFVTVNRSICYIQSTLTLLFFFLGSLHKTQKYQAFAWDTLTDATVALDLYHFPGVLTCFLCALSTAANTWSQEIKNVFVF